MSLTRENIVEIVLGACAALAFGALLALANCQPAEASEYDWDDSYKKRGRPVKEQPLVAKQTVDVAPGSQSVAIGGDSHRYDVDGYPVATAVAGACGGAVQLRDVGAALNPLSSICELSAGISTALGVCAARQTPRSKDGRYCPEADQLLRLLMKRLQKQAEPEGLRGGVIRIIDKTPILGARWLRWLF